MPPILETERLRLRRARMDDLPDIYRLGSNPRVMQFISPGQLQSLDEARKDLRQRIKLSAGRTGYWITERKSDQAFIGWMALKPLDRTRHIELGYRFLEEHWGNGYATEAANRVLSYAFQTLGLEQVVAVAMKENRASIRVMEKLGLEYVKDGYYYKTNCVFYAIPKEAFLELKHN